MFVAKDKKEMPWQSAQQLDFLMTPLTDVDARVGGSNMKVMGCLKNKDECKGRWSGKYNGAAPIVESLTPSQYDFLNSAVGSIQYGNGLDLATERAISRSDCRGDSIDANANRLWSNVHIRPEINLDLYRNRIRQKYGLASASRVQVAKLSRLERSLSQSNAGLRQQLAHLTAALDRSDALCASESATRVALDEKFSQLLKSLPVGVVELDSCGLVKMTNPAAEEILGRSVIGCAWFDVVRKTFKPQADDGFEISTVTGRRISVLTQSLDDRAGQLILLNDQTDTRKLQARLAHSDRLAALGRTAATLAHQVRTPVCGALLYLSQASMDEALPQDTRQRIHKAVGRLEHLERQVKQILMLARGEVQTSDCVSIGEFIAAMQAALAPVRAQTDVQIDFALDLALAPKITINQEALIGCIVNVVENAILACAQQGNIKLSLEIGSHETVGQALMIHVVDDGQGMDAAALKSATEPFFTSRADGTGLGLSMVKMVMEAHGGSVDLVSALGAGTRVTLVLPMRTTASSDVKKVTHQE